ncbi:low molecular weight phosphotyrosine protein phosphatase [Simiduia sp. 21SJ11W-1]|uniref:low molecular weight protein-tyrosine-phosphatase n=1 Tax=Simiduia sp. 21SJ11W-1 TaxID=2909669 RepID=UPI0020A025D8|nr:low molecular weight protein-tyrosine-phosphatase [Simiduia sp. 21SJ11W-1]UTA49441.1 low molecular weight phosphotyrosine protein phosphatase [Simiduia sp. 21SJ11W-1]
MKIKVLMVCLGNICRSPTAEGVLQQRLKAEGLAAVVQVDSAGTAGWHVGKAPDARSQAHALRRGYDLSSQASRQVTAEDFNTFDYILAMDQQNLADLRAINPANSKAQLQLFLAFAPNCGTTEVPDPYYEGEAGFEQVLDLIEQAASGFIAHLRTHDLSSHTL